MAHRQTLPKTLIGLLLLCSVLLVYTGCDPTNMDTLDTITNPDTPPAPGDSVANAAEANTRFGMNLFHTLRRDEPGQNIFISPFSISAALAMTLNGADHETEQAMTDTLQLHGLDRDTINADYAGLHTALATAGQDVTLTIANSLWAQHDFQFQTPFLQKNTQFFGAELSTLDFQDPAAAPTINEWVRSKTNGQIEEIVDDGIDPNTVLILVNALYFKGAWQHPFTAELTQDGTFHLASGAEKVVPMMTQQEYYPYYAAENFQAVSLPYGDGEVQMSIFLPNPDSDLNSFLAELTAENWEQWMSQFHREYVGLTLPRFQVEYGKTLNDTLKTLGMAIAFDSQQADFSRMGSVGIGNLYIEDVVHKAFVEVDEAGTEASAATSIGIGVTSLPPPPIPFTVDRPFFFAIQDTETQTLLFMGAVVEP